MTGANILVADDDTAIRDLLSRDHLQFANLGGGFRASVSLDVPADDIDAGIPQPPPLHEHRPRLADTRRAA